MKLIECVPNFSEGRDRAVIDAITREISAVPAAVLLDVDAGAATNRTVVSFVGPPAAVEEAAFRAIARAAELIDMARHQGEHPRMGATDVCPFVPMSGATMDDCIAMAQRVGRRVGDELGIPVYLYAEAATRPDRRRLPDIRQGEYEALAGKLRQPEFVPDFGPREFNARSGATVVGAREFLIAWNVNLNTRDKRLASKIAAELRETGKAVRGKDGTVRRAPGRFSELQAGGWYIGEYGRAQITCNLTNYRQTSLQQVFDACREEAGKLGLRVTGSELVGLVPLEAVLAAGDHYRSAQGQTTGVPEAERIHTAMLSLGLGELTPFDPREKIIEHKYRALTGEDAGRDVTLAAFLDELSSDSAAPGGGSVAALAGALAAALASMVAVLSFAKKGLESARPSMQEIGARAQQLKDWFLDAVSRDAAAFNAVLTARRLPQATPAEQAARTAALEQANRHAVEVPLEVLARSIEVLELLLRAARDGNPAMASDAGVGAASALTAAEGAALNVRINLSSVSPEDAQAFRTEQERLLGVARELASRVRSRVEQALES